MKLQSLKVVACKALLAAVVVAGMAACSQNEYSSIERKTVKGLPTVTTTDYARADVKVDAIDYTNRSIALTGSDGKTQIFTASPAVRNFEQLKKGDTVKVEYLSTVTATVRKVGEEPSTEITDTITPAELGDKPGIIVTRKAVIRANVEYINLETREVRLKNATGDTVSFTASKKLKGLDKVLVGDQVVFNYTEAVSIQVN